MQGGLSQQSLLRTLLSGNIPKSQLLGLGRFKLAQSVTKGPGVVGTTWELPAGRKKLKETFYDPVVHTAQPRDPWSYPEGS